jgi:NAD-dependent SIR2 family protein deacetylase
MQIELQKQLLESFKFYETDIACGNGWYELLWNLSQNIDAYLTKNKIKNFKVIQVKEKFGSLRFYTEPYIEELDSLITQAENQSVYICENCGAQGRQYNINGWVTTICDYCMSKN